MITLYRVPYPQVDSSAFEWRGLLEADPKSRNCRQYLAVMPNRYSR